MTDVSEPPATKHTVAAPAPTGPVRSEQPTASSVSGEQPQRTLPFWVAIFFGWIVWALAVGAAAGKNWLKLSDIRVGGPEYFNEACDAGVIADTWCATFKAFSAMQIIATLLVSIAMVILMGTLFFPEARVRIYGLIGGGLFLLYSFFQLVAVSLFAKLRNSLGISVYSYSLSFIAPLYGDTFGAACTALIFGIIVGIVLLMFAGSAGEGPLCAFAEQIRSRAGATTHQAPAPPAPVAAHTGPPPPFVEAHRGPPPAFDTVA